MQTLPQETTGGLFLPSIYPGIKPDYLGIHQRRRRYQEYRKDTGNIDHYPPQKNHLYLQRHHGTAYNSQCRVWGRWNQNSCRPKKRPYLGGICLEPHRQIGRMFLCRTTYQWNMSKVTDKLTNAKRIYTNELRQYKYLISPEIHRTTHRGTNHIERNNLTIHTHIKRLTRRTICFSRKAIMFYAILKIYFWGGARTFNIVDFLQISATAWSDFCRSADSSDLTAENRKGGTIRGGGRFCWIMYGETSREYKNSKHRRTHLATPETTVPLSGQKTDR